MRMPFVAVVDQPEDEHRQVVPLMSSDIRFCFRSDGPLATGVGERSNSTAAPFARFASKVVYPMTNGGASTVASAATDTATWTATPYRGNELHQDDSNLDDR